jgi:hypothetical protein
MMVFSELAELLAHRRLSRKMHRQFLAEVLAILAAGSRSPKTLSSVRQRSLATFASLTANRLIHSVSQDRLRYLTDLTRSFDTMLLTDIERCPPELVEWYEAMLCELGRNGLL